MAEIIRGIADWRVMSEVTSSYYRNATTIRRVTCTGSFPQSWGKVRKGVAAEAAKTTLALSTPILAFPLNRGKESRVEE
jgi:hypothetical protein